MSKKLKVPTFKSDEDEHEFWMTHDSSDYESKPIAAGEIEFAIPVKKVISLRIDPGEYEGIKRIARQKRVRPTSLMRDWVELGLNNTHFYIYPQNEKTKSKTGLYIGIGVVAVVAIGFTIYFATRKK